VQLRYLTAGFQSRVVELQHVVVACNSKVKVHAPMLVRFAKKKVLWTELDYERMNWCSTHNDF